VLDERQEHAFLRSCFLPLAGNRFWKGYHVKPTTDDPLTRRAADTSASGVILVSLVSTGGPVGFLSRQVTSQGNYAITNVASDFLSVTLSNLPGPVDMIAQNSVTGFPAVGGVVGQDSTSDITNNLNDAILAGTVQTAPGAPPQVVGNDRGQGGSSLTEILSYAVESCIWFLEPTSKRLSATWSPGEPAWDGVQEPVPTGIRLSIRFATWEGGVTMVQAEEFDAFKTFWERQPPLKIGDPPKVVNEVFLTLA